VTKTIYIAGPMTGLPDYNYPAFFDAACELALRGFVPANPGNLGAGEMPYKEYLKAGIKLLLTCDAVALLDGWENSRGAKLEYQVAHACGIDVRTIQDYLRLPKVTP
jgi:hypothetical protein